MALPLFFQVKKSLAKKAKLRLRRCCNRSGGLAVPLTTPGMPVGNAQVKKSLAKKAM